MLPVEVCATGQEVVIAYFQHETQMPKNEWIWKRSWKVQGVPLYTFIKAPCSSAQTEKVANQIFSKIPSLNRVTLRANATVTSGST